VVNKLTSPHPSPQSGGRTISSPKGEDKRRGFGVHNFEKNQNLTPALSFSRGGKRTGREGSRPTTNHDREEKKCRS